MFVSGASSVVQGLFPPVVLDGELDAFRATDIGTVLQGASEAVSMANQKLTIQRMADFYLRMPMDRFGMFAFGALRQIEGIGYEHARGEIAEWKSQGRWIGGE